MIFIKKIKEFDICLISQFLPKHVDQYKSKNFEDKQNFNLITNHIYLIKLLYDYLEFNNVRFVIALRTDEDKEYYFYKNSLKISYHNKEKFY